MNSSTITKISLKNLVQRRISRKNSQAQRQVISNHYLQSATNQDAAVFAHCPQVDFPIFSTRHQNTAGVMTQCYTVDISCVCSEFFCKNNDIPMSIITCLTTRFNKN